MGVFPGSGQGKVRPEAHQSLGVGCVAGFDLTHAAGELAEEERRCLLVVPHVGT